MITMVTSDSRKHSHYSYQHLHNVLTGGQLSLHVHIHHLRVTYKNMYKYKMYMCLHVHVHGCEQVHVHVHVHVHVYTHLYSLREYCLVLSLEQPCLMGRDAFALA